MINNIFFAFIIAVVFCKQVFAISAAGGASSFDITLNPDEPHKETKFIDKTEGEFSVAALAKVKSGKFDHHEEKSQRTSGKLEFNLFNYRGQFLDAKAISSSEYANASSNARVEVRGRILDENGNIKVVPMDEFIYDDIYGASVTLETDAQYSPRKIPHWGIAYAIAKDPFYFKDITDEDKIFVTLSLNAGTVLDISEIDSAATRTIKVTTNIPNLEELLVLELRAVNVEGNPILKVKFISNSALGISDLEIEDMLKENLKLSEAKFLADSDISLYEGNLPIPSEVRDFYLSIEDEAKAAGSEEQLLLSVKLDSFTAVFESNKNSTHLTWLTGTETNNAGSRIWRATKNQHGSYKPILLKEFSRSKQVNPELNENCSTKIQGQLKADNSTQFPELISAIGNSREGTCYSFTDISHLSDGTYYYLLESISDNDESTFHCKQIDAVTIGQGPATDLKSAINYCKEVTGSNN